MKKYTSNHKQNFWILFIFLGLSSTTIFAQSTGDPVCADGDCSTQFLDIKLEETLQTSTLDSRRTDQFKAAYFRVKQLKQGHEVDGGWKYKYRTNGLNGKSCVRLYQLEGQLVYEYQQNPAFKQFIEQNESDVETWKENGFQSSRKAINMRTRMNDQCPQELKKMDKDEAPKLEDLPPTYMKLGITQGYFDEKGKRTEKKMEDFAPQKTVEDNPDSKDKVATNSNNPSSNNAASNSSNSTKKDPTKMSKKEQIADLKDRVSKLPVGPNTKNKIDGIKNGLTKAKPKLGGLLGTLMGPLKSKLATFLPGPVGILPKIQAANDVLGVLKNFVPKISVGGLLGKIGGLFKRGDKNKKKAKELADKGKKLKNKYDDLTKKAQDLDEKIKEKEAMLADLQDKMDALAKKQKELADKLEDKPRKILEELHQQVNDVEKEAKDLNDKVGDETKAKDKLVKEVDDVEQEKEAVEQELAALEQEMKTLEEDHAQLEQETEAVQQEVEDVKKQEAALDAINALVPEDELTERINLCEALMRSVIGKIKGAETVQGKIKDKAKGIFGLPDQLLGKLSDMKMLQNKLKLGKNGIPLADKAVEKVDGLLGKANVLGSAIQLLTGKKGKLQEKIEQIDGKINKVKDIYINKTSDLAALEKELVDLALEKTGLKDKLKVKVDNFKQLESKVDDFINRYNLFDEKVICNQDVDAEVEEINKGQKEVEPEVEELEDELEEAEKDTDALDEATKEVEKEIEADTQKAEELKLEEDAIKEQYGQEVKLDSVTVEEWSESFEVERPYWDAVFHPDDELVDGFKGRYFEVSLKDADKNIKVLFPIGKYFMDKKSFRKSYGRTMGTFVTEALHHFKKGDADKVKLFIQGSADIVGSETFRGKLEEGYMYNEVPVLPQKEDKETFSNQFVNKDIPETDFRNHDLPNLRAMYLKEMIAAYTKQFDPILLEGVVTSFEDKEERNAIIYLFFPEALLTEDE